MSFSTRFKGLWIEYEVEPYSPAVHTLSNGDPGYPAEGGYCTEWEAEDFDDLDEFLCELESCWARPAWWRLGSRMVRWVVLFLIQNFYRLKPRDQARMFKVATQLAAEHWEDEIMQHCTEHYWDDIGGPDGEWEYYYGG